MHQKPKYVFVPRYITKSWMGKIRSNVSRNALWVEYKKRLLPGSDVVHVGPASETFLSPPQEFYSRLGWLR